MHIWCIIHILYIQKIKTTRVIRRYYVQRVHACVICRMVLNVCVNHAENLSTVRIRNLHRQCVR